MFENHRKGLILQQCERSQLRLQKFIKNAKKKIVNLTSFEKLKFPVKECYQSSQFQLDKIVKNTNNF